MEETQEIWEFNGGLKLQAHKKVSKETPIATLSPQKLYRLPVQQHIGEAGEVIVKVGDKI
jgi:electron transport complex protein RnfC